ncbi:MAG: HAD hydrolase-like protein, partial [bacterium]|nr:HAD hydrolase-like protein [bacterium]
MAYRSVIFDLDGTLSDSSEGIMKGVRYAMERFGVTDIPEATLRRFIGPPLYDTFSQIFGLTSEQADHAVALYREYYLPKGMYENRLYPGIKELLERLKEASVA